MSTVEEFAGDIRTAPVTGGQDVDLSRPLAHHLIKAGYRKVFDGDCGLSGVTDPGELEAAEAWMRWANLAMNDAIGAIGAMQRMLTEFGYRKPRQVTTVEELDALPNESLILDARNQCREGLTSIEGRNWWRAMGPSKVLSSADIVLPATVLYEGSL